MFIGYNRKARAAKSLNPARSSLKTDLGGLLDDVLHPIAEAHTEGFHSKVHSIKAGVRAGRRFKNCLAQILFRCVNLNPLPE